MRCMSFWGPSGGPKSPPEAPQARGQPTPAQQAARDAFKLDEAMTRLPPPTPIRRKAHRLSAEHVAVIDDQALRDFAREVLGAQRCREEYLHALRIVLGNQAEAEDRGRDIEHCQRVESVSDKALRTIIKQMHGAGILYTSEEQIGDGKMQTIYRYGRLSRFWSEPPEADTPRPIGMPPDLTPEDIPY